MTVTLDGSAVGRSMPRIDGPQKVTGSLEYADDTISAKTLHARLVLSQYAHARIVGVDRDDALRQPGVVAVLLAADLPTQPVDDLRKSQPLARDEVYWVGQPVAIVVAETERAAQDGAALVEVRYEPLAAVLDPSVAMVTGAASVRQRVGGADSGATSAHGSAGAGDEPAVEEVLSANVSNQIHHRRGSVADGFAESAATVERQTRTSSVHQCYLEPQTATAAVDAQGVLRIWSSTQSIFYTRKEVAASLGLPMRRVKVTAMPIGGGFGGKVLLVEPLVAAAALAVRQPVRLTFTRSEEFLAGNPTNASEVWVKIGARADGTLAAIEGRIVMDAGAFPEWSAASLACLALGGYYRSTHLQIDGYDVMTHRAGTGSYRAPGAPQATFAIETAMDELAEKLGMDPLELRLKNAVREGDPKPDGSPWGRIGLVECLERLRSEVSSAVTDAVPESVRTGTGIAVGGWPGGLEPAAALCRLDQDGGLVIVTGSVDLSGTNTSLALIAAETFGVQAEDVRVTNEDSEAAPYAGMTGGSKITYTVGRAVQKAAEDARRQVKAIAADLLEVAADDVEIVNGRAQAAGAPDRFISVADIAAEIYDFGGRFDPVEGRGASAITTNAPGFVAHSVRVSVDPETADVKVIGYVAVQDVGRAINPASVEGQVQGGVAQGIGWALLEGMPFDEAGQVLAGSFLDYAVANASSVPEVRCVMVEVPAPDGPFGAKGVGEPPVIPVAAAVANAIYNAVGVRPSELPITPQRLFSALTQR